MLFLLSITKLYVPVFTLTWKGNQKLSKLSKEFKRLDFVEFNRLFILIYLNQDDNMKRYKALRFYLPKGIIKLFYKKGIMLHH